MSENNSNDFDALKPGDDEPTKYDGDEQPADERGEYSDEDTRYADVDESEQVPETELDEEQQRRLAAREDSLQGSKDLRDELDKADAPSDSVPDEREPNLGDELDRRRANIDASNEDRADFQARTGVHDYKE